MLASKNYNDHADSWSRVSVGQGRFLLHRMDVKSTFLQLGVATDRAVAFCVLH